MQQVSKGEAGDPAARLKQLARKGRERAARQAFVVANDNQTTLGAMRAGAMKKLQVSWSSGAQSLTSKPWQRARGASRRESCSGSSLALRLCMARLIVFNDARVLHSAGRQPSLWLLEELEELEPPSEPASPCSPRRAPVASGASLTLHFHPSPLVEEALKSLPFKKAKVGAELLMTTWGLWRALSASAGRGAPKLPLPPRSRLIPRLNSFWSKARHLSDATTSLIDARQEKLGTRAPQAVTLARVNDLLPAAPRRSLHAVGAKDDLELCDSLARCGEAASKRLPRSQSTNRVASLLSPAAGGSRRARAASLAPLPRQSPTGRRIRGVLNFMQVPATGYIPIRMSLNFVFQLKVSIFQVEVLSFT